jgi:hypothetical protein
LNLVDKHFVFNYNIEGKDKENNYPVDCMVNSVPNKPPLFIFAITNDSKCKDVTINILQYENWGVKFNPIGIFEDQTKISRKTLAKFSDVTDKQFSNLDSNKERINKLLENYYN